MTKMTIEEAKELLASGGMHGGCLYLKIEDINLVLAFLDQQEKEKQELKAINQELIRQQEPCALTEECDCIKCLKSNIKELKSELDKWKPKFYIGQEVWFYNTNSELDYSNIINEAKNINRDGTKNQIYQLSYNNLWFYEYQIFATKQEAEQAKEGR